MFNRPGTLSDCGVEMEKARLLGTSCAYSGGRLCELGEPVFPEHWTEALVEGLGGDAEALLSRTSISGVVCSF